MIIFHYFLTFIFGADNISTSTDMTIMKRDPTSISEKFKVLGNETRLEIFKFLATGEKCVCNIFEHLKLAQNLVSHHLGVLRKSEIITSRKDGKWVHYSINTKEVKNLNEVLNKVLTSTKKSSNC